MMIFNVGDLKKLIQDLDDDIIVQLDDGKVYSGIDDARVLHNTRSDRSKTRSDRSKVLSLHTQRLFLKRKDYF